MKEQFSINDQVWVMYNGKARQFNINGVFIRNSDGMLMYSIKGFSYCRGQVFDATGHREYQITETNCFKSIDVFSTRQELLDEL